jgi:hypothetical protein
LEVAYALVSVSAGCRFNPYFAGLLCAFSPNQPRRRRIAVTDWQRNIFMLETILIISGLVILGILFYPRRSKYVSRTTKSYNGYGRERGLH